MTYLIREDSGGEKIQAFELPITGKTTTVALTTSNAVTAALAVGMYRFHTDVTCSIVQGATAATTDMLLIGGVPEYFHVSGGGTVAAIMASGTATLTLTLC